MGFLCLCFLVACDAFSGHSSLSTSRSHAPTRPAVRVRMAESPLNRRQMFIAAAASLSLPSIANAAELGYRPSKPYGPGGYTDPSASLSSQLADLKSDSVKNLNTIGRLSQSGNLGVKGAADAAALGQRNAELAARKAAKGAEIDQKAANQAYAISGKGL